MVTASVAAPVAAGPPPELWAALLLAGFVLLSLFAMWLASVAVGQPPAHRDEPLSLTSEGDPSDRDWSVLRVAPDQLTAEMWVALLREEGVPAAIKPSDAVSFLGMSTLGCRVLVPNDRLERARALLAERVGEEE